MRRAIVFLVSALFMCSSFAISGNEFWEKKNYSQWTQRECEKMLQDSPWAKTHMTMALGREMHADHYYVQLRSALPVRMAIVRSMQIASNYDKLSSEQRQEFDKKAEEYLSTGFPDKIVVQLIGRRNVHVLNVFHMGLINYWQARTTELLKDTVFLVCENGNRIPLLQFNVSKGEECEFQFIFPKQYQGVPVLGSENKSFKLECRFPRPPSYGDTEIVVIEFKAEKLMFNGKLEY